MIQIDLGCGKNKQTGFIGIDRYPLPGVDVLVNLNETLPFRDESVDLIFASHSLEHVESLLAMMKEIYRVCKHGAQICILAPYSEQKLNVANPYHRWQFNEHTPRFWTAHPRAPIDPEDFNHPQAPEWGLASSDNSDPALDLRLVRMEYFYFPQYASLPAAEQRKLRKERMDVCDQIMYHLIVWKDNVGGRAESFDSCVSQLQPFEPEYLRLLRQRGADTHLWNKTAESEARNTGLTDPANQFVDARSHSANERDRAAVLTNESGALHLRQTSEREEARNDIGGAAQAHVTRLTEDLSRSHKSSVAQAEVLCQLSTELHDAAAYNRILRDEAARIGRELETARSDLLRESAAVAAAQREASSLRDHLRVLQAGMESNALLKAKLSLTQAELEATAALLGIARQKEDSLRAEVAIGRRDLGIATAEISTNSQAVDRWRALHSVAKHALEDLYAEARTLPLPVVRIAGFLIGRSRPPHLPSDNFVAVRNYCDRHFRTARASLVLGGDLKEVPYREYEIPFGLDNLKLISLALRPLLPGSAGSVGIEIVSSESEIVVQIVLALADVKPGTITEFQLPVPLRGLKKRWRLRIFARGTDAPVPLYELAKGAVLGGETQYFPFVSFT